MKILFTTSDKQLSKTIRSLTGEPVSHCAMQFGKFVVHSNLRGLHIAWADNFKKTSRVLYSLSPTVEPSEDRLADLLEKHEFSWYDFSALLFLGLAFFVRSKLKVPLPKSNLWQSTGMFLCTEWITEYIDSEEDSMITPHKLYLRLKASGDWKDSE